MPEPGGWTIGLCNPASAPLMVWLEPSAEEFTLPPGGELALGIESEPGQPVAPPELAFTADGLVVYAGNRSRVRVFVDGIDQESFLGDNAFPDLGPLTARGLVNVVFAGFPEARPAGRPFAYPAPGRPWWKRWWPRDLRGGDPAD